MSVQVAAENPAPVLPFEDPSRKRRMVKIVGWLVGIVLVVVLLNLLGIDIIGWLQDSGIRSRRSRPATSSPR